MTGPAYHGWTHRPKSQGGTDPVPFDLPYISGNRTSNQLVTTNAELVFESAITNDPDTFAWDSSDPAGLLIYREGLYQFFADVHVLSPDIAVPRSVYNGAGLLSSGPGVAFGNELGDGLFALGTGQGASSVSSTDGTIGKSRLVNIALAYLEYGLIGTDPFRGVVVLGHQGTNDYTVGNITSALTIVRLSGLASAAPGPH